MQDRPYAIEGESIRKWRLWIDNSKGGRIGVAEVSRDESTGEFESCVLHPERRDGRLVLGPFGTIEEARAETERVGPARNSGRVLTGWLAVRVVSSKTPSEAEGKNRKEIIRCLKRHIAREVYRLLTKPGNISPTPLRTGLTSQNLTAPPNSPTNAPHRWHVLARYGTSKAVAS